MSQLGFSMRNAGYCVDILNLEEIISMADSGSAQSTFPFTAGVVKTRGKAYPVINLGNGCACPSETQLAERGNRIVKLTAGESTVGLVVDKAAVVIMLSSHILLLHRQGA
jgi:chemotaxis signal transduction protein